MLAKDETKTILSTLDSKEWQWLERFLASPYHNSDERLLPFHQRLRNAPDFELEATEHYPDFFPGQPFVSRKWGDLLRKYLRMLQAFLAQEELRRSPTTQSLLAIESRKRKKLYTLLPDQIRNYEKAISTEEQPPWDTANAYRVRWQQAYELPGQTPRKKDILRATEYNRLLFCLLELRYRIEQQTDFKDDYAKNRARIDPVVALAQRLSTEWPLLRLNLMVYECFCVVKPSAERIAACQACYYELFPDLYPYDRTFFFTKISTLLNRQMEIQEANGREKFFRWQKFAVDQDIYLAAEKMTEMTFLNICTLGIAVKEFDWVAQFREKYLSWVSVTDTTNIYLLSGAMLAFGRGDYGAVYLLSSQATRLTLNQRLSMYGIQIKAHTEVYLSDRSNANPLRDYLRSADRALRYHQTIPERLREGFLNLIKILRRLVVWCENGEHPRKIKQRLEAMLLEKERVVAGEWLREKIAQL
jgi:hypothetical protein